MKSKLLTRASGYIGLARDLRTSKKATDDPARENARLHLAQRMGKLHGLPQKIGQIMSMSGNRKAGDPFADLSDNAQPTRDSNAPMPLLQINGAGEGKGVRIWLE